ncbi:MAG: hypothetical protein AAF389_10125 [Gemmatimonadota bacterium]
MNLRVRGAVAAALLVALATSCEDATNIELLEIPESGVVAGLAYLDLNGNGSFDTGDSVLVDVIVELTTGGSLIVAADTTDTAGAYVMENVPLGRYGLAVASSILADSLESVAADTVTVLVGDTAVLDVGATFPNISLEEALASPAGLRVFTSGIALGPRVSFGDGQVHFRGATGFLRALNVERVGISIGDSVRLRGRVVTDNARPALDSVTVDVLINSAALVNPTPGSTGFVASADGGALDGGLAQIDSAEITDTMTVGDDFHVWVDDGSGPLEIVLRGFLNPNPAPFAPDWVVRIDAATGLVSPFDDGGTVRWRMLPRQPNEVLLETKFTDLALTMAIDDTAAIGDTVAIDLEITNNGPFVATGVTVADTLPSGLTYLSSSGTVGSFNASTHSWTVGQMLSGQVDSLRILSIVTTPTLGPQVNTASVVPPQREVDNVALNNSSSAAVQLEAPRPIPCSTSTDVCEERFEIAPGVYLPAFTSHSMEDGNATVSRAVIMVHDATGDVEDFFDTSVSAATAEGELGQTLLIAPHFQTIIDGPTPDEARWSVDGWRRGDPSQPTGAQQVSSYSALDRILDVVADSQLFPAITEIVVTGHGTGGDLVHRIAALSDVEDEHPGISFRYVPANAESYLYTGPERDVAGTFQLPDTIACSTHDNWLYGLESPNTYVGAVPSDSIEARLTRRDVRLLLADADTLRDDATCGADLQGVHRFERGQFFKRFVDQFLAGNGHVELVIPGVGHVQLDVFTSAIGRAALFGN